MKVCPLYSPLTLRCRICIEVGRGVPYSAIPSLDGRWKRYQQLCDTISAWRVGGLCSLLCNAFSGWKVEGVSPCSTIQSLDWRLKGVNNSAIPFLDRTGKVCQQFCNAVSGWKGEGVSPTLQYHLWMVGEGCVPPYSAIPPMDGRWKGVNNSAIPFLDGTAKVCHLLCNTVLWMEGGRWYAPLLCSTVFAWKLEGVSPTLQYLLWIEEEDVSPALQYHLWMEGMQKGYHLLSCTVYNPWVCELKMDGVCPGVWKCSQTELVGSNYQTLCYCYQTNTSWAPQKGVS